MIEARLQNERIHNIALPDSIQNAPTAYQVPKKTYGCCSVTTTMIICQAWMETKQTVHQQQALPVCDRLQGYFRLMHGKSLLPY